MKTLSARPHEVRCGWFVIDIKGKVLSRVATGVAHRLCGKHESEYTPHIDTGDYIIVINADKLRMTGAKFKDKKYFRHSGFPGGICERTFCEMQEQFPGRALEQTVKGALSGGPLDHAVVRGLRVYASVGHDHTAQQPKVSELR